MCIRDRLYPVAYRDLPKSWRKNSQCKTSSGPSKKPSASWGQVYIETLTLGFISVSHYQVNLWSLCRLSDARSLVHLGTSSLSGCCPSSRMYFVRCSWKKCAFISGEGALQRIICSSEMHFVCRVSIILQYPFIKRLRRAVGSYFCSLNKKDNSRSGLYRFPGGM